MLLTLYKTEDDRNVINKTKTEPEDVNVRLFRDFNIFNPEIKLSNLTFNILNYNYIYMVGLGRYYFIDEIVNNGNGLFTLNCSLDVLETFKTEILSSNYKYKRKIGSGDYGEVEPTKTGKMLYYDYVSNVELIKNDSIVLTGLRFDNTIS